MYFQRIRSIIVRERKEMKYNLKTILGGLIVSASMSLGCVLPSFAATSITLSPMEESLILNPGDTYSGSFLVVNSAENDENLPFKAEVIPYYVNEDYSISNEPNSYTQITEWTTLHTTSGTVVPDNNQVISFTIDVPNDAPAGGQYMAIRVSVDSDDEVEKTETPSQGSAAGIHVNYGIAYVVYAEITGTTYREGEVYGASVPSFLLSGAISGSSLIKNTGNVHSDATYKLKVFPLFSNEEVYTNEENPETRTVLPDRTYYNETYWPETPAVGIFNVIYTVECEGVTTEVSKMVIVCPLWLLFLIIFGIALMISWLAFRVKGRRKARAL